MSERERVGIVFLVCSGLGGASALAMQAWIGRPATYGLYALIALLGTVVYTAQRGKKG